MYRVTVHYANGGQTRSWGADLDASVTYAHVAFATKDYLGRHEVRGVEVHEQNERGGWKLLAL